MKLAAITVWEPWASQILNGQKTVENRTWRTQYRGPLLIHTGKRRLPGTLRKPAGALGVARLIDCHLALGHDCECDRWQDDLGGTETGWATRESYGLPLKDSHALYHLVLREPFWLDYSFPTPGRQMLWYPNDDVRALVTRGSIEWEGWRT